MQSHSHDELAKIDSFIPNEKAETLDVFILLFLILSIFLPAIVSVPHGFFDIYFWKTIALFICVSISILLLVIKWAKYKINPLDWKTHLTIGVLFLSVSLSSVLSKFYPDVILGSMVFREGTLVLFSYYFIFITFKYYISTPERIKKVFYWIFFSGAVLYVYAWLQVLLGTQVDEIFSGGTFGHRNYMASYYTLLLIPAAAQFFYAKGKKMNIIYYILSCAFFSTMIIVHTRSAWVGSTIGFILFFIFTRKKFNWKKTTILLGSFMIIVVMINGFYGGLIVKRFDNMINDAKLLTDMNTPKTDKSLAKVGNNRYPIWELALKTAPKYIWLGAGPDAFANVFPQYEYFKITGIQERCANAHNEYLNMLVNTGIFSLLAYLCLIAIIIRKFIKTYKNMELNNNYSFIMIGVFCGWCSYLVQALFNNSVVSTSPTLWAVMGVLSAIPSTFDAMINRKI